MTTKNEAVPLTRSAQEEMQRELDYLRTVRRREVAENMREVWESELDKDFDAAIPYEYAKEDQALVEGRIATLEDLLARASIIDEAAARASDIVQLGSVVVLERGDGVERVYQLVGSAESDPSEGKLSQESPVGAAVLGKKAGDTIQVEAPAGVQVLRVKELR